ncbi:hypothetical protein CR513_02436, partial [Mucuna pruriens]
MGRNFVGLIQPNGLPILYVDNNMDESNNLQDPLQGIEGPMTRARTKSVKEALQCLVKDIQAKDVDKQVSVPFVVGKYKDEVLCDVIPVEKITLVPLSPKQDFQDVFLNEVPSDLLSIRGIEHHIDLIPRIFLPKRPTYKSYPNETTEIQK